jgi:hypothetical protein
MGGRVLALVCAKACQMVVARHKACWQKILVLAPETVNVFLASIVASMSNCAGMK